MKVKYLWTKWTAGGHYRQILFQDVAGFKFVAWIYSTFFRGELQQMLTKLLYLDKLCSISCDFDL